MQCCAGHSGGLSRVCTLLFSVSAVSLWTSITGVRRVFPVFHISGWKISLPSGFWLKSKYCETVERISACPRLGSARVLSR